MSFHLMPDYVTHESSSYAELCNLSLVVLHNLMYPHFTHVSKNKLSLMLKNENFPCFVLTCSPKRVVCGPAGREHGGKHGGVSVPDDDAAGLSRHRQGPLVEQDGGRHRPILLLLGVRAHSGNEKESRS